MIFLYNYMAEKFREFKTSSGKRVLGGKTAENNEQLISQVKDNEIVLHTAAPGSPFVNIKFRTEGSKTPITKKDIYESAVFCAKYSQAWKKAKVKKDVLVHVFKGKDVYKSKGMKLGTFGVKKHKKMLVKKEDIEKSEKPKAL